MKRKLSALLAIVLVAVMVFPTAIFVGADADIVVKCGGETVTSDIVVVTGHTKTLTIETSATIENVAIEDNAVATVSYADKTITLTGRYAESGTTQLVITYKMGEAESKTYKLGVKCMPIALDGVLQITMAKNLYLITDTLTTDDVIISGMLNTGDAVAYTVEGIRLSATGDYKNTVSPEGGENTLYFKYKITNEGFSSDFIEDSVTFNVASQKIETMDIAFDTSNTTNRYAVSEKITSANLIDKVIVLVKYDGKEKSIKVTADSLRLVNSNGVEVQVGFEDYKANKNQYSIEVTYENKTVTFPMSKLGDVSDVFNSKAPASFVATPPANQTYIVGQKTIDFSKFSVLVYASDETELEDCTVTGLKMTGTLTAAGGEVDATATIDGKTVNGVIDFSTATVIADTAESMTYTNTKTSYTSGATLDKSALTFTVKCKSGSEVTVKGTDSRLTYGRTDMPTVTAEQSVDVVVFFKDTNLGTVDTTVKVTVKPAAATSSISSVVYNDSGKIKEYYVGEKLDATNYGLTVVFTDKNKSNRVITLDDCEWSAVDTTLMSSKTFKKELAIGDLEITYKLPERIDPKQDTRTLTIKYITVVKRPTLNSITASTTNATFLEGEAPKVKDFVVVASYVDTTKQFVFKVSDYDDYDTYANKTTYTHKDGSGTGSVTYKMTLTPSVITSDTKAVRVAYSEQIYGSVAITKYFDVDIEVTVPDAVLTYYDTTEKTYVSKAYIDFEDALKAANEIVRSNNSFTTSYYNRVPEIQLRRDVTMTSDWPVSKDLIIDLNGHSLTMIRGEVYVASTAGSDIVVTFTNDDKNDAKLIYSTSDDDTIILGEDDTFTIDKTTRSDVGKYDVTISSVKNGKVDGPREVTHGHDAKFTITPDEDYKIKSISVKEDKATKKYTEKDGVVTVEDVQGALTITVTFEEKAWDNPFTDVYKSATYYKSIQFVYENGLFSGMSATKFEPDTTMTRAMFVTVLGRLANVDTSKYTKAPSFTDVSTTDQSISYAIPYIQWATEKGLITGYGNGKFGPKDNITHIQMYVLMQRYAGYIEHKNTDATSTSIPANDVSDIPTWAGAKEAVQYAAKYDFLVTSSNRITPNNNAKRSELAVLLDKFCENVLEWEK